MGKIKRGGFVFVTGEGDHSPYHVHVYRDGKLVLKWNLEEEQAMRGRVSRRIRRLIAELRSEGRL